MTAYDFDGSAFETPNYPPIDAVPIMDILNQAKKRVILNTSKGSVIFKHISLRTKRQLDLIRAFRYPNAKELEDEASIVYPMALAEGADEETVKRATEIAAELAPSMDVYALGVIEYPFFTTVDDLQAWWQTLQPEEIEAIRQLLVVFTNWNKPIDYGQLEIAERFHVQLIDRELIENPTYQQYLALHNIIEQEHRQTEEMYKKMGAFK